MSFFYFFFYFHYFFQKNMFMFFVFFPIINLQQKTNPKSISPIKQTLSFKPINFLGKKTQKKKNPNHHHRIKSSTTTSTKPHLENTLQSKAQTNNKPNQWSPIWPTIQLLLQSETHMNRLDHQSPPLSPISPSSHCNPHQRQTHPTIHPYRPLNQPPLHNHWSKKEF